MDERPKTLFSNFVRFTNLTAIDIGDDDTFGRWHFKFTREHVFIARSMWAGTAGGAFGTAALFSAFLLGQRQGDPSALPHVGSGAPPPSLSFVPAAPAECECSCPAVAEPPPESEPESWSLPTSLACAASAGAGASSALRRLRG